MAFPESKGPNLEQYMPLLQRKRDYVKRIYPLDSNNWILEAAKDGVIIHSLYDEPAGLKIIRSQTLIKAPLTVIIQVLEDIEVGTEWDKSLESIKAVHKFGDTYILHTVVKKLPLVVQREAVIVGKLFYEPDGVALMASTSINYPGLEESIYRVRATAHLIGWYIKPDPLDAELTEFTLIMHVDPEGWVPKWALNWFAYTEGFNVRELGKYVENVHKEQKRQMTEENEHENEQ